MNNQIQKVATNAVAALGTAVFVLGSAGMASAVPIVSVEFGGSNTITVTSPGSIVTASVFIDLTSDFGLSSYALSIDFDTAGDDVLDFVGGNELLPPGLAFHLTPGCCDNVSESGLGSGGSIFGSAFEAIGFGTVLGSSKFLIGTLQFEVTGNYGTTNITPRFGPGELIADGVIPYSTVNIVGGTVVHAVPEPGTAALLAFGLGAVTLAGRRRRRRA